MNKLLYKQLTLKFVHILELIAYKILLYAKDIRCLNLIDKHSKYVLNKNLQFKNKHKNKRAFVIVNGPSLKKQNLSKLKNDITFVVSGFYNHDVINEWQPTYYSILDKTFFNGTKNSRLFFDKLNSKIKSSIFFIPLFRGFKSNYKHKLLPLDKTFYIATAGSPSAGIKLNSITQSFQSVSSFALAQAVYMGCNPIYLLGFDHDYLANHLNYDHHFYESNTIPNLNRKNIKLKDIVTYKNLLINTLKLWENYISIKNEADISGIKIINLTNGGYLDIFERGVYEEIMKND